MRAGALADAAKVNTQRNQACLMQSARGPKNDFVVHRAAAERMRVQYQRGASCGRAARLFQDCFELAV